MTTPRELAEKIYFQGKWSGTNQNGKTWSVAWIESLIKDALGEKDKEIEGLTELAAAKIRGPLNAMETISRLQLELQNARAAAFEECAKIVEDNALKVERTMAGLHLAYLIRQRAGEGGK